MIASKILLVCLQALAVVAQTPSGFTPTVAEPLQVTYGTNELSPPGKKILRSDTAQAPTIGVPKNMVSSTAKGLLVMIDPDVAFGGRKYTFLHWLVPNVDLSKEKATIPITGGNIVPYFQPSPPAGDPPHRYTFILYSQPGNFSSPPKQSALGFDVNTFAKAAGLGQPKAATFMQVQR